MLECFHVNGETVLRNQFVSFPDGSLGTIKEIWADFLLILKDNGDYIKIHKHDFYLLSPDGDGGWSIL